MSPESLQYNDKTKPNFVTFWCKQQPLFEIINCMNDKIVGFIEYFNL
jgi:hypothetical protein